MLVVLAVMQVAIAPPESLDEVQLSAGGIAFLTGAESAAVGGEFRFDVRLTTLVGVFADGRLMTYNHPDDCGYSSRGTMGDAVAGLRVDPALLHDPVAQSTVRFVARVGIGGTWARVNDPCTPRVYPDHSVSSVLFELASGFELVIHHVLIPFELIGRFASTHKTGVCPCGPGDAALGGALRVGVAF